MSEIGKPIVADYPPTVEIAGATEIGNALISAADAAAARSTIGAGTSNLKIGTAATDALSATGKAASATKADTATKADSATTAETATKATTADTATKATTADSATTATTAASATKATTADAAAKLSTARTVALTGAVTGTVSFDGSANVSITTVNGAVGVAVADLAAGADAAAIVTGFNALLTSLRDAKIIKT